MDELLEDIPPQNTKGNRNLYKKGHAISKLAKLLQKNQGQSTPAQHLSDLSEELQKAKDNWNKVKGQSRGDPNTWLRVKKIKLVILWRVFVEAVLAYEYHQKPWPKGELDQLKATFKPLTKIFHGPNKYKGLCNIVNNSGFIYPVAAWGEKFKDCGAIPEDYKALQKQTYKPQPEYASDFHKVDENERYSPSRSDKKTKKEETGTSANSRIQDLSRKRNSTHQDYQYTYIRDEESNVKKKQRNQSSDNSTIKCAGTGSATESKSKITKKNIKNTVNIKTELKKIQEQERQQNEDIEELGEEIEQQQVQKQLLQIYGSTLIGQMNKPVPEKPKGRSQCRLQQFDYLPKPKEEEELKIETSANQGLKLKNKRCRKTFENHNNESEDQTNIEKSGGSGLQLNKSNVENRKILKIVDTGKQALSLVRSKVTDKSVGTVKLKNYVDLNDFVTNDLNKMLKSVFKNIMDFKLIIRYLPLQFDISDKKQTLNDEDKKKQFQKDLDAATKTIQDEINTTEYYMKIKLEEATSQIKLKDTINRHKDEFFYLNGAMSSFKLLSVKLSDNLTNTMNPFNIKEPTDQTCVFQKMFGQPRFRTNQNFILYKEGFPTMIHRLFEETDAKQRSKNLPMMYPGQYNDTKFLSTTGIEKVQGKYQSLMVNCPVYRFWVLFFLTQCDNLHLLCVPKIDSTENIVNENFIGPNEQATQWSVMVFGAKNNVAKVSQFFKNDLDGLKSFVPICHLQLLEKCSLIEIPEKLDQKILFSKIKKVFFKQPTQKLERKLQLLKINDHEQFKKKSYQDEYQSLNKNMSSGFEYLYLQEDTEDNLETNINNFFCIYQKSDLHSINNLGLIPTWQFKDKVKLTNKTIVNTLLYWPLRLRYEVLLSTFKENSWVYESKHWENFDISPFFVTPVIRQLLVPTISRLGLKHSTQKNSTHQFAEHRYFTSIIYTIMGKQNELKVSRTDNIPEHKPVWKMNDKASAEFEKIQLKLFRMILPHGDQNSKTVGAYIKSTKIKEVFDDLYTIHDDFHKDFLRNIVIGVCKMKQKKYEQKTTVITLARFIGIFCFDRQVKVENNNITFRIDVPNIVEYIYGEENIVGEPFKLDSANDIVFNGHCWEWFTNCKHFISRCYKLQPDFFKQASTLDDVDTTQYELWVKKDIKSVIQGFKRLEFNHFLVPMLRYYESAHLFIDNFDTASYCDFDIKFPDYELPNQQLFLEVDENVKELNVLYDSSLATTVYDQIDQMLQKAKEEDQIGTKIMQKLSDSELEYPLTEKKKDSVSILYFLDYQFNSVNQGFLWHNLAFQHLSYIVAYRLSKKDTLAKQTEDGIVKASVVIDKYSTPYVESILQS